MRALSTAGLLVFGLLSAHPSYAQLVVGPVSYPANVEGVPVTVKVTTTILAHPGSGGLAVTAKVDADLFDLQQKIGQVVDAIKVPVDNCAASGVGKPNPVVAITSKGLAAEQAQAIFAIGGHVDIWSCVVGPPKTEIQWQMKRVGPIKTKVAVPHTWTSYAKNKDATQPFDATIPVTLVKESDTAIAVRPGQPNIRLEGQYAFVTNGILKIANVDINQKACEALQRAVDLSKLKATLPQDLQKLDMKIDSAQLSDDGGHVVAEVDLTMKVTGASAVAAIGQILPKVTR